MIYDVFRVKVLTVFGKIFQQKDTSITDLTSSIKDF
jgi:hypothetical protein